jgi:hypothetical protein
MSPLLYFIQFIFGIKLTKGKYFGHLNEMFGFKTG